MPEPGPGEVRDPRVAWAALNHLDVWVRRGVPGHRFPLPLIAGLRLQRSRSIACGPGVVGLGRGRHGSTVAPGHADSAPQRAVGRGRPQPRPRLRHLRRDLRRRQRRLRGGARRESDRGAGRIPARSRRGLPTDLPHGVAHAGRTAARLKPWERVLIHAAGSGVSRSPPPRSRSCYGAQVMVTAGSDDKVAAGTSPTAPTSA